MEAALVSVSQGVMKSLLGKLGALLTEEYKLQKGARGEVRFLKAEMESMNAFLEKMSEVEEPDVQAKAWTKEVRELSYDMEDCIDEFMHHLHADPKSKLHGFRGFMERTIKLLTKARPRHRIAAEIHDLKSRVVEVSERRARLKVDEAVSKPRNAGAIDPRLSAMYQEAANLVGIDGPKEELVKLLMAEEESLKVVSIVGMGGLGKTTLANAVYRELKGQFECAAFVSVSQKPDLKKVLRQMLSKVGHQDQASMREWDENELITELRESLEKKRYFIIIDDIWSIPDWDIIKCALVENNRGSRIMATTRISVVAKCCCYPHEDYVWELKSLDGADSKKLFSKRIYCDGRCPAHLEEVSNKILKKCGGLPLAIITIASMFVNKPKTKTIWERMHNSIGFGLGRNSTVEQMMKILSLSYNDLPCYLKPCLLFLSIYPEDYEIHRDHLIRRWGAERLINTEGGQHLEEAGECYFNELINRSMIQPVYIDYEGQAWRCRIHDMIRDLIISKAVEENFVTLFGEPKHSASPQDKIRRLSLDCRDEEYTMVPSTEVLSHVRSLILFGNAEGMPSLSKCRVLRVLDLYHSENLKNRHIEGIGILFQLKRLFLGSFEISKLPEQIGELQYLETLDIESTAVRELPASIVRLRRLVHLLVSNAKLPDGIGNMQALQELRRIDIYQSSANSVLELGNLNKLRTLSVTWHLHCMPNDAETYTDNFYSSVSRLSSLRSLSSFGCTRPCQNLDSRLPFPHLLQELFITHYVSYGIPEWMASLRELTRLDISIKQVRAEDLQLLADLPALLSINIRSKEVPQKRLAIGSRGFLCLKRFGLGRYSTIMWLMFEAGAMPMLEVLHLDLDAAGTSARYGTFDFGIQHLSPSLKNVNVSIWCGDAKRWEVEAAEAAFKNAVNIHPNHPTLDLQRAAEDEMKKEVEKSEEEDDREEEEEAAEEIQSNT